MGLGARTGRTTSSGGGGSVGIGTIVGIIVGVPLMLCLYALALMVPLAIVAALIILGPSAPQAFVAAVSGAYHGFSLALVAVSAVLSTLAETNSLFLTAIAGALGGAAVAWVRTALRASERRASPISALFAPELWQKSGVELVVLMLIGAGIGYLVALAFSAVGLVATSTHAAPTIIAATSIVFGGGGYSGGGDFPGLIAFIAILFAMIIAGAVIGAGFGGLFGSLSSIGVWTFDVSGAVHGATAGATTHLLLGGRRKSPDTTSFVQYVLFGTMTGAIEGMITGAAMGAIIELLDRLLH